jgi:hypothetical protein
MTTIKMRGVSMTRKKRGVLSTITFKGPAANRIFAQMAADLGGEKATDGMAPGTELHRMTVEEIDEKKSSEEKSNAT